MKSRVAPAELRLLWVRFCVWICWGGNLLSGLEGAVSCTPGRSLNACTAAKHLNPKTACWDLKNVTSPFAEWRKRVRACKHPPQIGMHGPPLMQYGKIVQRSPAPKTKRSLKTTSDMGGPLHKHVSWSDLWFLCGAADADCSDVELIHHCQQTLSLSCVRSHTTTHRTDSSLYFEFPLSFFFFTLAPITVAFEVTVADFTMF